MTATSSSIYVPYGPRDPLVENRLQRFKRMNAFISARGGWVTSPPGDVEVRFEALPGSVIPGDLHAIGYRVFEGGEGERIVTTSVCSGIVNVNRYAIVLNDA